MHARSRVAAQHASTTSLESEAWCDNELKPRFATMPGHAEARVKCRNCSEQAPPPHVLPSWLDETSRRRSRAVSALDALHSDLHYGTILFTHMQRAGGSDAEMSFMMPRLACMAREHATHFGHWLNCGTSLQQMLAAHGTPSLRVSGLRAALQHAGFVYRHCPYGLHPMLPAGRPHVYVTFLREPISRMASWHTWCRRSSPTICGTHRLHPASVRHRADGTSAITRFFEEREHLPLVGSAQRGVGTRGGSSEEQMDDNYMVRMIVGASLNDAAARTCAGDVEQEGGGHASAQGPPPAYTDAVVGEAHLRCAMRRLYYEYSFVGDSARQDESLCVLGALLGWSALGDARIDRAATYDSHRAGMAHANRSTVPDDFHKRHRRKFAFDSVLYTFGALIFEEQLEHVPSCRRQQLALDKGSPNLPALLARAGIATGAASARG
jgi:hypothetical protein